MTEGGGPPHAKDPARLPRQIYRLRVMGLALGFLSLGSVLYERGASLWVWAGMAFYAFVWPHVAWWRACHSQTPNDTERQHLLLDSALGGVWVPVMHFCLLPSVLFIGMLAMDKIGWGAWFLRRNLALMVLSTLVTVGLVGWHFEPHTSMTVIVASLPLLVAYPVAIAVVNDRQGSNARGRRRALEQAAALREQLAHAARVGTLGEMAAGIAHELNQPLTAIHLGASAGLALGDVDSMKDALTDISDQALRAGEIVRRMRTFARRTTTNREAISLAEPIRDVLHLLDHDIRTRGVTTAITIPGNLPKTAIDRIEIQQVLVNLIRNALEAMDNRPAGERHLGLVAWPEDGYVRVSVTDTGGGVDPAILGKLFHPFQSTKTSGLGLGLSISQSLIEAHGGRVGAGPHPPGGATFYFDIPAAADTARL